MIDSLVATLEDKDAFIVFLNDCLDSAAQAELLALNGGKPIESLSALMDAFFASKAEEPWQSQIPRVGHCRSLQAEVVRIGWRFAHIHNYCIAYSLYQEEQMFLVLRAALNEAFKNPGSLGARILSALLDISQAQHRSTDPHAVLTWLAASRENEFDEIGLVGVLDQPSALTAYFRYERTDFICLVVEMLLRRLPAFPCAIPFDGAVYKWKEPCVPVPEQGLWENGKKSKPAELSTASVSGSEAVCNVLRDPFASWSQVAPLMHHISDLFENRDVDYPWDTNLAVLLARHASTPQAILDALAVHPAYLVRDCLKSRPCARRLPQHLA